MSSTFTISLLFCYQFVISTNIHNIMPDDATKHPSASRLSRSRYALGVQFHLLTTLAMSHPLSSTQSLSRDSP
jgi:hypothetical protein